MPFHYLFVFLLLTLSLPPMTAFAWEALPKPPAASGLAWVSSSPKSTYELWAASAHQVFWMNPRGSKPSGWQEAGFIQSAEPIRKLWIDENKDVFILTQASIYRHRRDSQPIARIFSRPLEASEYPVTFAAASWSKPVWFAGTAQGLYVSADGGQTWSPHFTLAQGKPVFFLAASNDFVFIGIENILYRAKSLEQAEPVYRFSFSSERESFESETPDTAESQTPVFEPVLLSNPATHQVWLASPQGVAQSSDDGKSWTLLSSAGLTHTPIRAFAYSEKTQILFAAAGPSIFAYHSKLERWFALEQNFHQIILSLTLREGSTDQLIAASQSGIFSYPVKPETLFPPSGQFIAPERENLFRQRIAQEPTARDVQKAVVRYSNLTNDKIRRWHRESRWRALLPDFSLGRDFSRSSNLDLDRGGTADPDRYITGPDDIDINWSADLSWDLGDLIWSPSQTSIDIREKLMVDQRRDFLAEAMRIYFERRRLQAELFFSKLPESGVFYKKQLHYEELTALLDSLTGGWFSEQLEMSAANQSGKILG